MQEVRLWEVRSDCDRFGSLKRDPFSGVSPYFNSQPNYLSEPCFSSVNELTCCWPFPHHFLSKRGKKESSKTPPVSGSFRVQIHHG